MLVKIFITYLFLEYFFQSLEKLPKLESNTENQARVVDHIKGLLSDIVTNTIGEKTDATTMFNKKKEGQYIVRILTI